MRLTIKKFFLFLLIITTLENTKCDVHNYNCGDALSSCKVIKYKVINPNISEIKKQNKTVYLTFDDGPSLVTNQILDILKEENVKATFFILDRGEEYDYIMKRIVEEGHSIGLHGSSHVYEKVYSSVETYIQDLLKISCKVQKVAGVDSKIIRFIGGHPIESVYLILALRQL